MALLGLLSTHGGMASEITDPIRQQILAEISKLVHYPIDFRVLDAIQADFLTVCLFAATCGIVLFTSGESTTYFTSSEVAFLFPSPLTRQELLIYKLLTSLIGITIVSGFMMSFSLFRFELALPRWLGIALTFSFLQLLTMNVAFARQILRERTHLAIRRFLRAIIGLMILIAIYEMKNSIATGKLPAILIAFHESSISQWLLAPFSVFTTMLRIANLSSFLISTAIVLAIDAALLTFAIRLDALSLEAALAFSDKFTARLKRIQTQGISQLFGSTTSKSARLRIPMLPFWGGTGPITWHWMTTTIRSSAHRSWGFVGVLLIVLAVVYMAPTSGQGKMIGPMACLISMVFISNLIGMTQQNDIERVTLLKSLPIRTRSIVLGELIGMVTLLSITQSIFIATSAYFLTDQAFWLLSAGLLIFPINFIQCAVDKLIFYIYPTRMNVGTPGDFRSLGKNMISTILKMLILGGCALLAGLPTLLSVVLFHSPLITVATVAVALFVQCIAIVPLVSMAFDRFDPGVTIVN